MMELKPSAELQFDVRKLHYPTRAMEPIEVISDGASQDAAAPDRTFRGFNIQQGTLQFLQLRWAAL